MKLTEQVSDSRITASPPQRNEDLEKSCGRWVRSQGGVRQWAVSQCLGTVPPEVVVMMRVIIQRKLGELGPEGSRKGVYSRQCVMQKEGLEYIVREFALPLATGEREWQGAWGSLLSWNSASWAGFVWQERRGSSCIITPTAGCDTCVCGTSRMSLASLTWALTP